MHRTDRGSVYPERPGKYPLGKCVMPLGQLAPAYIKTRPFLFSYMWTIPTKGYTYTAITRRIPTWHVGFGPGNTHTANTHTGNPYMA